MPACAKPEPTGLVNSPLFSYVQRKIELPHWLLQELPYHCPRKPTEINTTGQKMVLPVIYSGTLGRGVNKNKIKNLSAANHP